MQRNGNHPPRTTAPRVTGWLALAGVSLIAGIASYFHALAVVEAAGARPPVAWLVPALADLVILGASADLLAASRAGLPRPRLTMLALAVGVVVTVAFNVTASHPHVLPSWLVDGWPAVAFVLALESLAGLVRRGRGGAFPEPAPATPGRCPHGLASNKDEAAVLAYSHDRDCLGKASFRETGRQFGMRHDRVAALVKAAAEDVTGAAYPPAAPVTLNGSAASE